MQYRISIFGSCISRDILDYDKTHFVPGVYVARQSFISSLLTPAEANSDSIKLVSNFQKRVVTWDIEKAAFRVLSQQNPAPDFLLVDFFEERFDLIECGGSLVTYSNEFASSGLRGGRRFSWTSLDYRLKGRTVDSYLGEFVSKITSIIPEQNIVLVMGLLSDTYYDRSGNVKPFDKRTLEWNKKNNGKFLNLYNRFIQLAPQIKTLDICRSFRGYEGNKWGLASTHFEDSFYQNAASILLRLVEGRKEPTLSKLRLRAKQIAISLHDSRLFKNGGPDTTKPDFMSSS